MTTISIEIELDEERVDEDSPTGLTEKAYEDLVDAVNKFGTIADGPTKVEG